MGLLLYRLLLVNAVVINALDMLTAVFRRMVGWPGQYDAAMVVVFGWEYLFGCEYATHKQATSGLEYAMSLYEDLYVCAHR